MWAVKCSTLNCREILKISIVQVSRKQNLVPHILKYAQQRMLRSKHKQQPKKSYLSTPSRIFKIEEMELVLWLIKLVYFF